MFLDILFEQTGYHLFNSRLFSGSIALFIGFTVAAILFPFYIKKLQKFNFSSELDTSKHQPVMPAGILFIVIITGVTLLTSRFNSYVISALGIYLFYSLVGAADDIAKIINKRKLQKGEISVKEFQYKTDGLSAPLRLGLYILIAAVVAIIAYKTIPEINGHITIPFLSIEKHFPYLPWWVFIPIMTLSTAILANGVNFTDGFDTLSSVPLITNFIFLALIAYISSRPDWSAYFLIPQINGVQEIVPLIGAAIGVLLAFLWFNAPPSEIIMGDSGSIGLGGMLGIMFVFVKAEFYIPIIAFIFIIEFASSFLQIFWYKLTKKRIFLCAPIHHHFQFKLRASGKFSREGDIRSKITWQFHITSVILFVVGTVLFLKVR
jgi:phospho-N-acetylmuramoyl-pentapeptide-transferase